MQMRMLELEMIAVDDGREVQYAIISSSSEESGEADGGLTMIGTLDQLVDHITTLLTEPDTSYCLDFNSPDWRDDIVVVPGKEPVLRRRISLDEKIVLRRLLASRMLAQT